jgi:RimJ/RimL family protein N-acetyltransferase
MNYQDIILKTERLELRPITLADAPAIFQILKKHPEVTDYLTFEPPKKQEETEKFIGQATKNMKEQKGMCWVIHFQGKLLGWLVWMTLCMTNSFGKWGTVTSGTGSVPNITVRGLCLKP